MDTRQPDKPADSGTPGAFILGGAHGSLAIARSLGRRGIPVWFMKDDHPLPGLSRYTQRRFASDGLSPAATVDRLLDIARIHGLRGWVLFAGSDAMVRLVAEHHARLGEVFRLTTPPWSIAQFAYDKRLTYAQADAAGIDYPHTYHPRDRDDLADLACRFPVVLKPSARERSNPFTMAKGWKASDRQKLTARYEQAAAMVGDGGIVLQEYIPGDGSTQFSYGAVWAGGAPVASLVARRTRQFPIDFGLTSTFVETIDNPAVEEAAFRFLSRLNYDGIVELEFKFDQRDGRYKLLDFNARSWTWMGLGTRAGVDFAHILFESALGRRASVRGRPGAVWMHLTRDLAAGYQHVAAGTLTPWAYLRSLHWPVELAAFAWDDPLPGVIELPLTLYRATARRVRFPTRAPTKPQRDVAA